MQPLLAKAAPLNSRIERVMNSNRRACALNIIPCTLYINAHIAAGNGYYNAKAAALFTVQTTSGEDKVTFEWSARGKFGAYCAPVTCS
jgi:hypothetical protein